MSTETAWDGCPPEIPRGTVLASPCVCVCERDSQRVGLGESL